MIWILAASVALALASGASVSMFVAIGAGIKLARRLEELEQRHSYLLASYILLKAELEESTEIVVPPWASREMPSPRRHSDRIED